ncbi:energy transducer TonB [Brevundimonas pondensis]|uniref:Energy transducer TonB n=1 Tax=Brevundimonas pondensis TaxID=2774189 RepID=A0ABX7SPS7_9CAUL|nr:energy transducer TonB [Brevundimonas pondensis]QTC88832.1 energy transducer TonB [Brevundimonas pondensis]
MTAEPHVHRDPILDPPKKKKKLSTGAIVGISISVIVHALAGLYLYNNKFKLKEMTYEDEVVDVELMEVPPPPPPKLQVREPQINTQAPPPPVTVAVEPTKKEDRQEYTGPPVIVPGPPPPPAPPAPPKPSVITNPSWSRQVQPEFPERANSRGIESGSAKVNCAVAPNGSLSDCRVVDEDPAGAGFGQAVLRAARSGRLAPRTVDGAAVGARVEFTTRFRLD